jgi:hypothetical protein
MDGEAITKSRPVSLPMQKSSFFSSTSFPGVGPSSMTNFGTDRDATIHTIGSQVPAKSCNLRKTTIAAIQLPDRCKQHAESDTLPANCRQNSFSSPDDAGFFCSVTDPLVPKRFILLFLVSIRLYLKKKRSVKYPWQSLNDKLVSFDPVISSAGYVHGTHPERTLNAPCAFIFY